MWMESSTVSVEQAKLIGSRSTSTRPHFNGGCGKPSNGSHTDRLVPIVKSRERSGSRLQPGLSARLVRPIPSRSPFLAIGLFGKMDGSAAIGGAFSERNGSSPSNRNRQARCAGILREHETQSVPGSLSSIAHLVVTGDSL